MIWGAVSCKVTIDLVDMSRIMDVEYTNSLELVLQYVASRLFDDEWTLQQEDTSVLTDHKTKEVFEVYDIKILDWTDKSSDSNIVQNFWEPITRKVFKQGRQYNNMASLQNIIMNASKVIKVDYIKTLYRLCTSPPYFRG